MSTGHLKIYLGYASHTGKTWRLLEEARRRKARGQDVVVGWLREKDQPSLANLLKDLELFPPKNGELDLDGLLKRKPHAVIIDELAHANPPGARNPHRWQDVQDLLQAGIGVVTAVNIQYLEAVQPDIKKILSKTHAETVPDAVIKNADEVLIVDASADSLIAPYRGDLSERDLLALRELALLYAANTLEDEVQEYRQEHHIETTWETTERVLVCLTGNPRGPHLIERAWQTAQRWKGDLWAIYVTADEHWSDLSPQDSARIRGFLDHARAKGAQVEVVEDADAARGILDFARKHEITQIFLGHGTAYPFQGALSRTVTGRVILGAEGIDVHVIADDPTAHRKAPPPPSPGPRLPMALARLLSRAPRSQNRGHQRIYLGYAPGTGKTFQMLLDGRYVRDHGQDVVVAACEACGREEVREQVGLLEVIPPRPGVDGEPDSIDIDAVLKREPQICLVDGLARPSAGGKRRWQDAEVLLEAGIHVFATLDVTEIEGLKDTVERIACVQMKDTVPDWLLDDADEVIFVDVPTRALLNRLSRGAVFPGTDVPEDKKPIFSEGCLNALRELALRLTADRVEDELEELEHPEDGRTQKDGVVACLDERPSSASIIRRCRRLVDRIDGNGFAVFVAPDEDWTGIAPEHRDAIETHLALARELHLETHVLYGSNIARAIVDFAIRHGATRVMMGRSKKTGWREFFRRSVIEHMIRLGPWLDVQVVAERA